jgi:hypothetical protein
MMRLNNSIEDPRQMKIGTKYSDTLNSTHHPLALVGPTKLNKGLKSLPRRMTGTQFSASLMLRRLSMKLAKSYQKPLSSLK